MITLEQLKNELNTIMANESIVERAKGYRLLLSKAIDFIYDKGKTKKPDRASLLELIDNDVVKNYINDGDIMNSLHYIRILGMNAQHGQKIKKAEEKLACDNFQFLIEIIENKENGKTSFKKLPYMSEANTRKLYIDLYLREAGWEVLEKENVAIAGKAGIEIKVDGMPNGQGVGFCDYVLYGRDGKPLAIVEAKKTSVSPEKGRHQVDLYGDCMKAIYGYKPVLYYTNGYETNIIDGLYPDRRVMAFHTIDELELMIQRRNRGNIADASVDPQIAGRPYQSMAITNLCEWFNLKHRRGLLVMATGTGKTRVSIALVDVLTRNKWIKNVLFLADRTSLVHQAKMNFSKLMPNMSICELSGSEDRDFNARLMFCTYQTMINYIDAEDKRFSSGRFDLIIIDEAHRSIFNKYGTIFTYFDSLLVGLTATPKSEVDANTYRVFGCESGMPNFDYSLEEAVKDHYLVPYRVFNRTTSLLQDGILYANLSDDERKQLENYYKAMEEESPAGLLSLDIKSNKLFRKIYNETTCKQVLEDVMTNGIKVDQGEALGKTIIFAFNHHHAEMIVRCFKELYPEYGANYCQLIDNQVNYADDLILKFESDDEFRIAVSVDMLDTGIDVPSVVNLVFFKSVHSKIKFVQMIGRGTRLCPDIFGPGKDKTHFLIFDYCGNFEFFEMHPDGVPVVEMISLSQKLFEVETNLLHSLQGLKWQTDSFAKPYYDEMKRNLIEDVRKIKNHSERIRVRNAMEYVDRYYDEKNWQSLSALDVKIICGNLTKLIDGGQKGDSLALSFDIRMKEIETAFVDGDINVAAKHISIVRRCCAYLLEKKASVPQVLAKANELKTLKSELYWGSADLRDLESKRISLRNVMKFLEHTVLKWIDVNFGDDLIDKGDNVPGVTDIRTYREKVLDYLAANSNNEVIQKIQNLEKIDADDLKKLEQILWQELGTREDYENSTDIDNLAVFVRSLVGLNQDKINEKFGEFLTGNTLNSMQQEFVKAIINYVRENGDIQKEDLLDKTPFDNYNLIDLFGDNIGTVTYVISILHDCVQNAA